MRVRIEAGGRLVEIECPDTGTSPREMTAEALATWKATDSAERPSEGPAFGLTAQTASPAPRLTGFAGAPLPVRMEGTE